MGRHSSSRSSYRRSSSRSPNRHRRRDDSRDRERDKNRDSSSASKTVHVRPRDDKKSSSSRSGTSNHTRGILDAKRRMREGLDSARSEFNGLPLESDKRKDESDEELDMKSQASRAREIGRIEEAGFQPAQFISTAGGAGGRVYGSNKKNVSKSDRLDIAENVHDNAIFGPSIQPKEAINVSPDDIPLPKPTAQKSVELIHPYFLIDSDVRKRTWLEVWREQRKTIGIT